jgi:hypothetical protein
MLSKISMIYVLKHSIGSDADCKFAYNRTKKVERSVEAITKNKTIN